MKPTAVEIEQARAWAETWPQHGIPTLNGRSASRVLLYLLEREKLLSADAVAQHTLRMAQDPDVEGDEYTRCYSAATAATRALEAFDRDRGDEPVPLATYRTTPVRIDALADLAEYARANNAEGMRAVACRMTPGACFCGAHTGSVFDGDRGDEGKVRGG